MYVFFLFSRTSTDIILEHLKSIFVKKVALIDQFESEEVAEQVESRRRKKKEKEKCEEDN